MLFTLMAGYKAALNFGRISPQYTTCYHPRNNGGPEKKGKIYRDIGPMDTQAEGRGTTLYGMVPLDI